MRCENILVGLALLFVATAAPAQQANREANLPRAEIALSNDTLQAEYFAPGGRFGGGNSQLSGSFFLSEDRDIVLSGSLLFPADVDLGPLSVMFGPRAYAALLDEENNDVLSLAVGAQLRFDINRRNGLAVVGHAFYAPDILTFGTADNLTDLMARAEMRLAEQLTGFVGMRWFEFDLIEGGGEQTLQDEVFVGVGWRF
jgi:hypothetical protein